MRRSETLMTVKKSKKHISKLMEIKYEEVVTINEFNFSDLKNNTNSIGKVGMEFSGRNDYFEINFNALVPGEVAGKRLVGTFDFGKTGHGFNSGFESLLRIDENIVCAVDTYHSNIIIPKEYLSASHNFKFEIWTGFDGGGKAQVLTHRVSKCAFRYEDITLSKLCNLTQGLIQVIETTDECSYSNIKYMKIITTFNQMIKMQKPYCQILEYLNEEVDKVSKRSDVTLYMFGHAHVDLAWLWTLKNGREKTIRTLATVLKNIEDFDDYIFLQSSPQVLDWIKKNEPEFFSRIKKQVSLGKIEIEGAMWVEADCNIPSGESLAKQLLYGKKFIKDEFNYDSKVLWLPDVFGYSWAMPQLLKLSNVDSFLTTKISWNKFNKMPHESFIWKGIDGSEIFTHFMTTPEPGSLHWNKTYTAEITADLLKRTWDTYEDKEINTQLPVSYGYGDGGGGPSKEMIEMIPVLNRLDGLPNLEFSNITTAVNKMKSEISSTKEYVHKWDGELYLEYHRGTYTTQGFAKKYNRIIESKLRELEIISVLNNDKDLGSKLDDFWKETLLYQFHDIIPGSSITEVYDELLVDYKQLLLKINQEIAFSKKDSGKLSYFNAHHIEEKVFCNYVSENKNLKFFKGQKELPSYYLNGKYNIYDDSSKAMENNVIDLKESFVTKPSKFTNNISTKRFEIEFGEGSSIVSIFDKRELRELVDGQVNRIVVYDDLPLNFDAWDMDIDYFDTMRDLKLVTDRTISFQSEDFLIIKQELFLDKSNVEQYVIIDSASGNIDFQTKVSWNEENKFMRVLFDLNINAKKATYDTQFGSIERANNWNTSWEMAKFEVCGHRYADISESNFGISIINDCKYGYNCIGNTIGLSLLRSSKYPDYTADIGTHEFKYSIHPHIGNSNNSDVINSAFVYNNNFDLTSKEIDTEIDLRIDNDSIELDTVKFGYNKDTKIMRFHESRGNSTIVNIKLVNIKAKSWRITNIVEDSKEIYSENDISISVKPYEIVSIELQV